jgi:hypothetical protein
LSACLDTPFPKWSSGFQPFSENLFRCMTCCLGVVASRVFI